MKFVILKLIKSVFIQYPVTQRETQTDINGFLKKFGFPQVIGFIDGAHMPIEQPNKNIPNCFSYKMKFTKITLYYLPLFKSTTCAVPL